MRDLERFNYELKDIDNFDLDHPDQNGVLAFLAALELDDAGQADQTAWEQAQVAQSIVYGLEQDQVWQAGIRWREIICKTGREVVLLTVGSGPTLRAMRVVDGIPQVGRRVHPNRREVRSFTDLEIRPDNLAMSILVDLPYSERTAEELCTRAKLNYESNVRLKEIQQKLGASLAAFAFS